MKDAQGPLAGRPLISLLLVLLAAAVLAEGPQHRPALDGFERLGTVKARRSTDIEDSYWGIQAGSLDEGILEAAAGIGVKWTRLQASWPAIEKVRGTYDFSTTDRAFDATLQRGITPFVDLVGANELYAPVIKYEDRKQAEIYGERPAPPTNSPAAMAAWLQFVEATVTRYKDRIRYWEIWNEPNHRAYWGAPPSARDYGRLLKETASLIKKLAPDARIVAGATAGMDAPFIDGFLAGGNAQLVDVVSYHQYEGEPEARMLRMVKVREVLDKHRPEIETWQGECGYPSASSTRDFRGRAPWGLNIQAKWLLRQAYSDVFLSRSTVSNYFILHSSGRREDRQPRSFLSDAERTLGYFPVRPDGTTDGARARGVGINEKSLLDYPSGTPKPGYFAYRNLCAILDKRYVPVTRASKVEVVDPGVFYGIGDADDAFPSVPIVATFERRDGTHHLAYWLPWHGQEFLPKLARIRLAVTGVRFADPVLVDLLSGEVFAIRDVVREGEAVVFGSLPLADYPFVIAERGEIGLEPATSARASAVTDGQRYRSHVFERVEVKPDVLYRTIQQAGDRPPHELRLDIYEPAGDTERARPAVLWIHGGGFRPGNDKRQNYIVRMATDFARRGYVSVSVDYRVRDNPTADLPGTVRDAVEDARAALEWVRLHAGDYGIDANWIAVGGGSAGGITAVNLVALENREAARAGKRGVFAVIDLWGSPSMAGTIEPVNASFPPTVIVHGTKDTTIPYALSEELASALKALGVPHRLHPIPDAGHTPSEHLPSIADVAAAFVFERLGNGRR